MHKIQFYWYNQYFIHILAVLDLYTVADWWNWMIMTLYPETSISNFVENETVLKTAAGTATFGTLREGNFGASCRIWNAQRHNMDQAYFQYG